MADCSSFDEEKGTIANSAGRVLSDGRPVTGEYVAGWIKRGPSGVIGTNRADGAETAASLLADISDAPRSAIADRHMFDDLLRGRGVTTVTWDDWLAIDSAEVTKGRANGRSRTKITTRAEMLEHRASTGDW